MLTNFFFSYFLSGAPLVFSTIILVIIIFNFFSNHLKNFLFIKKISAGRLILVLLVTTILFNLALSVLQYLIWHSHPFTLLFLPPHQPWSYFLRYAFFHFWLADILALIVASIFYCFLSLLRKYKEGIISRDNLNLLTLSCLLLGWPKVIIFIPLFFIFSVIDSIINITIFKNKTINISSSILIALLTVFLFANYLLSFFNLAVLII